MPAGAGGKTSDVSAFYMAQVPMRKALARMAGGLLSRSTRHCETGQALGGRQVMLS